MAHTVFVDGVTTTANRIVAAWLNDADTVTYVRFGDGTNYTGNLTVPGTSVLTGVATLTAQPILSSLTASLPVFSDASKGLVSNTMTGTGSVMMSASPTTTGTLTAAAINASGLVAMAGAATVGTTLGVTGATTLSSTLAVSGIISANNNNNGIQLSSSGGSGMHIYGSAGTHQWDIYLNSVNLRIGDNTGGGSVVIDTAATVGGTLSVTGTSTMAAINASGLITATTAGVSVPASALGNVHSGTYTPTLTNTANVSASTASTMQYCRVGNVVTVSGNVNLTITTTLTTTLLEISLPVASSFTTLGQAGGSALPVIGGDAMNVYQYSASTVAVRGVPVQTGALNYTVMFQYLVL